MNIHGTPARDQRAGQATFEMANLRPTTTGLPFIVFISQKGAPRHAARVKVAPAPGVRRQAMSSYSIDPFRLREGPGLSGPQEFMLASWIALNRAALIAYWTGAIEYTEDVIARLHRYPGTENDGL